jgi:MFS family permease
VQGLYYAAGIGILRLILISRFHFSPFQSGIIVAVCGLISIIFLWLMHHYAERLHEKRVLLTIAVTSAIALLAGVFNIGFWGFFVILALYAGERVLYPFMSETLNRHSPENQRATVLSVASFFRILPYIALGPIIGSLNTNGKLQYFLIGWALLICFAITTYLKSKKKDELITTENL